MVVTKKILRKRSKTDPTKETTVLELPKIPLDPKRVTSSAVPPLQAKPVPERVWKMEVSPPEEEGRPAAVSYRKTAEWEDKSDKVAPSKQIVWGTVVVVNGDNWLRCWTWKSEPTTWPPMNTDKNGRYDGFYLPGKVKIPGTDKMTDFLKMPRSKVSKKD